MEMAPQQEASPCVQKDWEGTAAHSAAGGRALDMQLIDYCIPGLNCVTCHQLRVILYSITAEPCSFMVYLGGGCHKGSREGWKRRTNQQTACCLRSQKSFRDRWKSESRAAAVRIISSCKNAVCFFMVTVDLCLPWGGFLYSVQLSCFFCLLPAITICQAELRQ